jgi:peptide deformylase
MRLYYWPDPILKTRCAPVPEVTDEIRELVAGMFDVMYANDGIGIAAPQVGRALRLFVLDVWWPQTGQYDQGKVFINPVVTPSKAVQRTREGCLSLPGVREYVERSSTCHVEALDEHGEKFSLDAEGVLAVCIQHENDHLDGLTMIDRVGPMTRRLLKKVLPSKPPPR